MENVSCVDRQPFCWPIFIKDGLLPALIEISGLCGILYSVALLYKSRNVRFVKYLLALCAWDLSLLLSTFLSHEIVALRHGAMIWNGPFSYLYLIFYPIGHISMTGSMWMVLAIAYERYMALLKPFVQIIRESQPVKWIFVSILLGSVIMNSMIFFELTIVTCTDVIGQTRPQITPTLMRFDTVYVLVYRVILEAIFEGPFPVILIVLLTLKTVYAMKSRRQYRAMTVANPCVPESYLQDTRITKLLLGVICKFIACYSCPVVINILEYIHPLILQNAWIQRAVYMSNLLVIFHSATNWLIFCRYRKPSRNGRTTSFSNSCIRLNKHEIEQFRSMWATQNTTELGKQMLLNIFSKNRSFAWHFGPERDPDSLKTSSFDSGVSDLAESAFQRRIERQGVVIGNFMSEVFSELCRPSHDCVQLVARIRRVGYLHFYHKVSISNRDWLSIKESLVSHMIVADPGAAEVCNRLVSFLIHQMKCGFLCSSAHELEHPV